MKILVAGASGFLGGHLVKRLVEQGHDVRAVGRRRRSEWSQPLYGARCLTLDLRDRGAAAAAVEGVERVYHLAAIIGGIGYLESRHADCSASAVVTSNLLEAAAKAGVQRFLFTSSACVYPELDRPLKESDVQPYAPRGGYGWSKLYGEQMLGFYSRQYGLEPRIARLGTVYGPHSPIGENEKAPIAICRKVAEAIRGRRDEIEIWGDGSQVRTFLYVDDCIDALTRLMDSDCDLPVNVAGGDPITVNRLQAKVQTAANVSLRVRYVPGATGVQSRMEDTGLAQDYLGWRESVPLREGLRRTYEWVESRIEEPAHA